MESNSNLNQLLPRAEASSDRTFIDNSTQTSDGTVRVYFRDLEFRLIQHIRAADAIFGCVAWLTNRRILSELAKKETAVVVQKEDFLRPDGDDPGEDWKPRLRTMYDALSCSLDRFYFGNIIRRLSWSRDQSISAVRCVGNHNGEKKSASPRMHNKFLVFAHITRNFRNFENIQTWEKYLEEDGRSTDLKEGDWSCIETYSDASGCHVERRTTLEPYAVWTGSFNLTQNASRSLENALYLTSPEIVQAYYSEFGQIMALSEPLDWYSKWVAPEWHVGS